MGQSESRQGQDVEVVFLDEDRWLWEEDSEPSKGVVKPTEAEASAIQYREYSLGFFHRTLGKGSFAVVKLAKHRITGHQVAVKIIKRQSTGLAKQAEEALLEREVKHQNLLRHQNVVRLHTWVTTPKEFLLVMEYCPKGDMLRYINELEHQQLRTAEARYFFAHLLEGLAFCHSLGICHRDLKLENLMLCPTGGAATASAAAAAEPPSPPWEALTLKIADFGLSDLNPIGILSTTYCGSPLYAAPELVGIGRREGFDASKSDAWSCGVILCENRRIRSHAPPTHGLHPADVDSRSHTPFYLSSLSHSQTHSSPQRCPSTRTTVDCERVEVAPHPLPPRALTRPSCLPLPLDSLRCSASALAQDHPRTLRAHPDRPL